MKWILATLIFGHPMPLTTTPDFNTLSGCEIYKHAVFGETVVEAFRVVCVESLEKPKKTIQD